MKTSAPDKILPPEVTLEDKPCPLSGSFNDEPVLVGFDRLGGLPGQFHVVRNRESGLMRTNPRPTAETIGYYYPDDYGPYLSTQVRGDRLTALPDDQVSLLRRIARRMLLHDPHQAVPDLPPGRLLEIGCASGSFLDLMARRGWQVEGIEPSETSANAARALGFHVYTGTVEQAPDPSDRYDLIAGWMVLEHLHEPIVALRKLHRWARPGAWLAASVPDCSSPGLRVFRTRWYNLSLPHHLYHYTPATLKKVLMRAGWQVKKTLWHSSATGMLRSLRNACQDRGWENAARWFEDLAARRHGKLLNILLGRSLGLLRASGRITIWAQRIDD